MLPFTGTAVNFVIVLIAGILGTLIRKRIPERITDAIMTAMGACVVVIGIDGVMEPAPAVSSDSLLSAGLVKMLIMIISMGLGTILGTLINIDGLVVRLGDYLEKKLKSFSKTHTHPCHQEALLAVFCLSLLWFTKLFLRAK